MSGAPHDGPRDGDVFRVDVIAGDAHAQRVVAVPVTPGETAGHAWQRSGLADDARTHGPPELAIFGNRVSPDTVLRPGDRVELLRPLRVDPREARRRRAALRDAAKRAAGPGGDHSTTG